MIDNYDEYKISTSLKLNRYLNKNINVLMKYFKFYISKIMIILVVFLETSYQNQFIITILVKFLKILKLNNNNSIALSNENSTLDN